jgi:hypothetical protein
MSVQVGKLTVRTARPGAGRDAGFRVRSESRLRSLDLEPPGLPDRAVLIVRQLTLPPAGAATAQQARAALASLRRAATRPTAGPVSAAAVAVLFRDEIELLTCLTSDLVHGTAGRRWYWRQIVPVTAPAGDGLAAAWTARPRWLPACLARLPAAEARAAVSQLSAPAAATVLQVLLTAFNIPERSVARLAPAFSAPPGPATVADEPAGEPPWRRWLPPTSLAPPAEALLGLALSLYHAPAVVRRPGYAERLTAWRAAAGSPLGPGPHRDDPANRSARGAKAAAVPSDRTGPGTGPAETGRQQTGAPRAGAPAETGAGPAAVPANAPTTGRAADPGAGRAGPKASRLAAVTPPGPDDPAAQPAGDGDTAADDLAWPGEGTATRLATLLYLVNFVAWLDNEEENEDDAGIPAGWALVELLGRYLLGDRLGEFAGDPVWDILAELDGRRRGTAPATGLEAAGPLRLPRAWLRRWPPEPAAGPGAGLDREAEERSIDVIGAFVAGQLRSRGIGVSSFTVPGRVLVTATHVDVLLSLQHVDLPARAAGLDRDPGWVPALGRIVLFHFLDTP